MRGRLLAVALCIAAGQALAGGSVPPGIVQSGTVTVGNCAQFSASGVVIDAGGTCGAGTSGVSQATGTASQILINGNASAHTGPITITLPSGVVLGTPGSSAGSLGLAGGTSGTITINTPLVAGTPTLTLPTVTGTLLDSANNLSDLGSISTALANLGILSGGTTAVGTSGATLPLLNGTNTWSGVQSFNSGDLVLSGATSGTLTITAAAIAGTNTLTFPAGTTDFSATGGTNQVVKQSSAGGAFTVGTLACANLSDGQTGCSTAIGTGGATIPLLSGNNTFSGITKWTGSLIVPMRVITAAGAVTISASTDYFLCINKTVGEVTTVNLPSSPATGLTFLIKDCKGDSAANPITVTPAAGTIDGSSTFVINQPRQSSAVTYDGTQWEVN